MVQDRNLSKCTNYTNTGKRSHWVCGAFLWWGSHPVELIIPVSSTTGSGLSASTHPGSAPTAVSWQTPAATAGNLKCQKMWATSCFIWWSRCCQENSWYFWSEYNLCQRSALVNNVGRKKVGSTNKFISLIEVKIFFPIHRLHLSIGLFYYYSKCFNEMFLLPSSFSAWNTFKVDLCVSVGQMCLLKC